MSIKTNDKFEVLLTCPAMINRLEHYQDLLFELNLNVTVPSGISQTLSEEELIKIVPKYDSWIIGDDPVTRKVLTAGKAGKLKICMKWGVGVDNVDFQACKDLGIFIDNTPGMFGEEVADVAIGYLIALARHLVSIDREVRQGRWHKPCGLSIKGKSVLLVGFGDIGRKIALRLLGFRINLLVVDPGFTKENGEIKCLYNPQLEIEGRFILDKFVKEFTTVDQAIEIADFLIVCCNLNESTHHLINKKVLERTKETGLSLINVSRGSIVDESALIWALKSGRVNNVALDVFETEPLPSDSELRSVDFKDRTIFGSHNASNTSEAVDKTSNLVIHKIYQEKQRLHRNG